MNKKFLVSSICISIIIVIYFFVSHPKSPTNTTFSDSAVIPTTSLENRVCEKVSKQLGDCKRILLYDAHSNLVFAESSSGIIPVLTNEEFSDVKKLIFPDMNFQEFREEKEERGSIDWRAKNKVQKDYSIIYGFAENKAKTIVINSEGQIQPNRFFVRDNLWVWYVTIQNDKVKLPVEVTVYDEDGHIIFGGNEMK